MELRIEKEFPEAPQSFVKENIVNVQICPLNVRHTNETENAIDTWKCHLVAELSGVDSIFPMHLWCLLLPQATQNLKLLRQYQINPRLTEKSNLNGGI